MIECMPQCDLGFNINHQTLDTGADTGFGGGVPRNLANDNMWREAPLETPKACQGEGTEGGPVAPLRRGGLGGLPQENFEN